MRDDKFYCFGNNISDDTYCSSKTQSNCNGDSKCIWLNWRDASRTRADITGKDEPCQLIPYSVKIDENNTGFE
jgi:hypothetical protein